MKISDLIALLSNYQDKYGDLDIMVACDDMEFHDCTFKDCSAVLAHDRRNDENPEQYNVVLSAYEYVADEDLDNYYRAVDFVPPEHRAEVILGLWINQD